MKEDKCRPRTHTNTARRITTKRAKNTQRRCVFQIARKGAIKTPTSGNERAWFLSAHVGTFVLSVLCTISFLLLPEFRERKVQCEIDVLRIVLT